MTRQNDVPLYFSRYRDFQIFDLRNIRNKIFILLDKLKPCPFGEPGMRFRSKTIEIIEENEPKNKPRNNIFLELEKLVQPLESKINLYNI